MASLSFADPFYVGKILLVDDKYDEAVQEAVLSLIERGMPVQYWNGKGDFPDTIRNVRVVILDLDLAGLGIRPPGPEGYYPAVEALKKIPGPFLVVIMAIDFNVEDSPNLKKAYEDYYGQHFPGFLADEGLTKDEELEDPYRLTNLVTEAIGKERILDLILLWEGVVDSAKDLAMKDLAKVEIENAIVSLIQSVCKELGEESAARQLVSMMLRLVSRSVGGVREFEQFDNLIRDLNRSPTPPTQDPSLYHRLMFFHPQPSEAPWTGDIYEATNERRYDQYAIILTPACDLAQRKTTSILVCFAFPLKEECLQDREYPPYRIDSDLSRQLAGCSFTDSTKDAVRRKYFQPGGRLSPRFYRIRHFADSEDKEPFGICFDFNNVRSIGLDHLAKWKRICRLDSPFVEDMLQKYGSHVFRIGTPDWNY